MQTRRATLEDLDYIMNCTYGIGKMEEAKNPDISAAGYITNSNTSDVAGNIVSDDYVILIGEDDKEKIGLIYGNVKEKSRFWKYDQLGYIDYLFIEKKYRKKGYAQALYQTLIDNMKDRGVTCMRLKMLYGNEEAGELYKKLGFKPVGVTLDNKL